MLDTEALKRINVLAKETEAAVKAKQMRNATLLYTSTVQLIRNETNGVDFYNVLKKSDEDLYINNPSTNVLTNKPHKFSSKKLG